MDHARLIYIPIQYNSNKRYCYKIQRHTICYETYEFCKSKFRNVSKRGNVYLDQIKILKRVRKKFGDSEKCLRLSLTVKIIQDNLIASTHVPMRIFGCIPYLAFSCTYRKAMNGGSLNFIVIKSVFWKTFLNLIEFQNKQMQIPLILLPRSYLDTIRKVLTA